MGEREPTEAARAIIDDAAYMTLATADADGRPWASPVWFASAGPAEFLWVSRPDTRHSQNIAMRPQVSIVVFDSRAPIDTGSGVYVQASAEQVTDAQELERAIAVFSERSLAQGGLAWTSAEVRSAADLRLYRATAERIWLGIRDRRVEVDLS